MAGGRPIRSRESARSRQSFVSALHDQFADELRECGEHVEDRALAGRGRVEGFVQRLEADPALTQSGHDRDQILVSISEVAARTSVVPCTWPVTDRTAGSGNC